MAEQLLFVEYCIPINHGPLDFYIKTNLMGSLVHKLPKEDIITDLKGYALFDALKKK